MSVQISVFSVNKSLKKYEKDVKFRALKILKILGKTGVSAEIFLADSRKMRALNKKYRGKDKTASILSFLEPKKFPHPEQKIRVLGEIYLNLSYIKKDDELIRLLIHGLLHLFGYTHSKKGDRIKMEKKENYVFNRH